MGWRGTAVLAILIVIVGAYLWLTEEPQLPDAPSTAFGQGTPVPPQTIRHLLDFQPADTLAIELEQSNERRSVTRADSGWTGATNPAGIEDFLRNLVQLGILADIPAGAADLIEYGLEPPQSVVRLRLRGHSEPLILQIGNRNPATTGVYARIGETGPVVLAGALLTWEFEKAFKAIDANGAGNS
jgi:hypothetical protein